MYRLLKWPNESGKGQGTAAALFCCSLNKLAGDNNNDAELCYWIRSDVLPDTAVQTLKGLDRF